MTKSEMLTEISYIHQEMKKILIRARISPTAFVLPDNVDLLKYGFIKQGYNWLFHIYSNEFSAVRKIWNLLPEKTWDRYFEWDCYGDHREVIMLKKTFKVLRSACAISRRPDLFKKGKINAELKRIRKRSKGTEKKNKSS